MPRSPSKPSRRRGRRRRSHRCSACIRAKWPSGRSRHYPDYPTFSATAASKCGSKRTTRRTNFTSKSASSKWSWIFSKKELACCTDDKRRWIDPTHACLTVQQQCELLGVPRSSYYYQPQPESAETLHLLRALDELYLKLPFFGSRKMAVELGVGRHRARRLMQILGVEAHYPKPHLSRPAPDHEVYPYLLRGLPIQRPNHVWSAD